jgi:hypothetical protein
MAIYSSKNAGINIQTSLIPKSIKPNFYFNRLGQFIGADNKLTNEIRIMNENEKATYINAKKWYIDYDNTYSISTNITNLSFDTALKKEILSKICTYAYKLLGYNYLKLYKYKIRVTEDQTAIFYVDGVLNPKRNINVCIAYYDGLDRVHPNLNTLFNMLNLLVHENYHFSHTQLDFEVLEEINAYIKMAKHRNTFKYITDDLRRYLGNKCGYNYIKIITDNYTRNFLKNQIETLFRLKYNNNFNVDILYPND